jgi:hypothetical protein
MVMFEVQEILGKNWTELDYGSTIPLGIPEYVLSGASRSLPTADCSQYIVITYVTTIHGHILNSWNNRELPHIYCSI